TLRGNATLSNSDTKPDLCQQLVSELPIRVVDTIGSQPSGAQDYILQERIDTGSRGKLWFARQPILDRNVCIKYCDGKTKHGLLLHCVMEATFVGVLDHPNIVPVY